MSAQKPKEPQYGDTVSLPAPDAACTPEQQRRRNGLRCVALFLRLRTAPRTGLRPRAGWLRLRAGGRPRVARPKGSRAARAAGAACGRVRPSGAPGVFRKAVGVVVRRASAAGPVAVAVVAVIAVSKKSRTESAQNTASPWSDAKTSDTGRTTPSCPSAFRQSWTQRPAALNCRKAASANKRTCLGGSTGN